MDDLLNTNVPYSGEKLKELALELLDECNEDGYNQSNVRDNTCSTTYEYFNHDTDTHFSMKVKLGDAVGPILITPLSMLDSHDLYSYEFFTNTTENIEGLD